MRLGRDGAGATQHWSASPGPREGCSEQACHSELGRRGWLGSGGTEGPPCRPPTDLVQQGVQHADAEDASGGEWQAEHEGQVGTVLPLPLRERGVSRQAPTAKGHMRVRAYVERVHTCAWCVACTRV